jgi:hypothetical protein
MGWDLVAYLNADQAELGQIFKDHGIDKRDWNKYDLIAAQYVEKHPELEALDVYYSYAEDFGDHEIMSTRFIPHDERLLLQKTLGKMFPPSLGNFHNGIRTSTDAIHTAKELRLLFPADAELMQFADWLDHTALYCNTYELSW